MVKTYVKEQTRHVKSKNKNVFFIFLLLCLAVLFITLLSAISQFPVQSLSIPSKQNLGIDYYHEAMGYLKRTDAEVTEDLSQIRQVTQRLKVYHNPFTSVDELDAIVQKAKVQKMYVVWTENDDSVVLTDANWSDYANRVIADSAVAHSLGVDEFLVGNEISSHNNKDQGYNDINLPMRIKQLVRDCQTNFPGNKGYEDGWYKSVSWHNSGLGPLNKIYFTLFEPWHTFKSSLDQIVTYFGSKAEIGEIGTMTTKSGLNDDEQDWTRDLMRRYDYARQKGIAIWLFAFKETVNNSFGILESSSSEQPHQIWDYLAGKEVLSYHVLLANDFSNGTTQAFSGDGFNYKHRLRSSNFNAQTVATVPSSDYVFRGVTSLISVSGTEKWRAMRIVVRYIDPNNLYFINIEPNDNHIQLVRRQNGHETYLGEVITRLVLGTDYDFEIRISGSRAATTILVFWNTVKIFDIVDRGNSSLNFGKVGMKNNGVVGDLADIEVTDFEKEIPRN